MKQRPVIFYGWFIVAISALAMMLALGTRHSFAVFYVPILEEFGWSRGSTALIVSLNLLLYGLLAPLGGAAADRFGPRKVLPFGAALLGLTTAACSQAQALWHFYLLFGLLMPLGTALTAYPVLAPTISNWFVKRRAQALGLLFMGAGLSFTLGILTQYLISSLGWRLAFVVLGGLVAIILIPLAVRYLHYRPEERGLQADGRSEFRPRPDRPERELVVVDERWASVEWTLAKAVRTYQLWLIFLAHACFWGVGIYLVLNHQVAFAVDTGYSPMFAASVFGFFGIWMAIGATGGFIADRLGRENAFTLACLSGFLAVLVLVSVRDTSQPWLLYFYAMALGLCVGVGAPALTAAAADRFQGKHFGSIHGFAFVGVGVGGGVGPWLGGLIFDLTDSYRAAFILSMSMFLIASLFVWLAAPRKVRRMMRKPKGCA